MGAPVKGKLELPGRADLIDAFYWPRAEQYIVAAGWIQPEGQRRKEDKKSIPAYFDWALRLTRPGGVVIVDNVVRDGRVADADSDDPDILGIRAFAESLAADTRVSATVVQTVGAKSYDGFALALVNG